jgi:cytochrome c peroxidase
MTKCLFLILTLTQVAFANQAKVSLGERLFNETRFSVDKSFSCNTCHQLDNEFDPTTGFGMRTYADFTPKTLVPLRSQDQVLKTLRNTPGLVGIGSPYMTQRFSHWDGEFADHSETVLGNLQEEIWDGFLLRKNSL